MLHQPNIPLQNVEEHRLKVNSLGLRSKKQLQSGVWAGFVFPKHLMMNLVVHFTHNQILPLSSALNRCYASCKSSGTGGTPFYSNKWSLSKQEERQTVFIANASTCCFLKGNSLAWSSLQSDDRRGRNSCFTTESRSALASTDISGNRTRLSLCDHGQCLQVSVSSF